MLAHEVTVTILDNILVHLFHQLLDHLDLQHHLVLHLLQHHLLCEHLSLLLQLQRLLQMLTEWQEEVVVVVL